jgi:hypothetical protein
MKCKALSLAIVAMMFVLKSSALRADSVYIGQAVLYQADGTYSSGDGGEFNTTLTYTSNPAFTVLPQNQPPQLPSAVGAGFGTPGVVAVFQTFCIQEGPLNDVTFNPGTYYAATVANFANNHNSPPVQTVSAVTAALFNAFWTGALPGYDYTLGSGRSASAAALQAAIWFAQGDNDLASASAEAGADPGVAQAFYNFGLANEFQGGGTGPVQVLGLYDTQADAEAAGTVGIAQAQLVEAIPNVGTGTPLPAAANQVMVLFGIIGAAGLVRRARRMA